MRLRFWVLIPAFVLLATAPAPLAAQMRMAGMENSAGYMSSGTSLEPITVSESAPVVHKRWGGWTTMFHMNADLVSVQQSGPRGHDKVFATNWIMPMLVREWGPSSLLLRAMISLEPATVTQRRYPELFQSGETAFGLPVVDGQHPHDLFMEIAARYDLRIAAKSSLFFYGGILGEPALGPTAFPHRASNSQNPLSTLGHHLMDSTHVSNSVISLGLFSGPLQIEASTFHGGEPNENRWNIDGGKPDSFAARITASLNKHFTAQFSAGRIINREALDPGTDTFRQTASVEHHTSFSGGHIATSLIWGRNKDIPPDDPARISNGYSLESTIKFLSKNWAWLRVENVDRDRTILVGEVPAALTTEETFAGRIQAYTFGYERDLPLGLPSFNLGLGTQLTFYGLPPQIQAVYGGRPMTFTLFLQLNPVANLAAHMKAMHR